jgi:hypothetical protein
MKRLFVAALKERMHQDQLFLITLEPEKFMRHIMFQKLIFHHKPLEVINFGTEGSLRKGLNGLI